MNTVIGEVGSDSFGLSCGSKRKPGGGRFLNDVNWIIEVNTVCLRKPMMGKMLN